MSKILDRRYIEILLENRPARVVVVHGEIIKEESQRQAEIDDQYDLAKLLAKAMKLPEDDPDRKAVMQFLNELGGVNDES